MSSTRGVACLDWKHHEALREAELFYVLLSGLIFKCGDVEEKPPRQEQQLLLEAEAEKLRANDSTKEMKEQIAQWTAKQQAAQLAKEAAKQQALGIVSAAELTGQEAQ